MLDSDDFQLIQHKINAYGLINESTRRAVLEISYEAYFLLLLRLINKQKLPMYANLIEKKRSKRFAEFIWRGEI